MSPALSRRSVVGPRRRRPDVRVASGAPDTVTLEGLFYDLEGATVSIPYDGRYGVAGSALFLVTHPRVDPATGITTLEGIVLL